MTYREALLCACAACGEPTTDVSLICPKCEPEYADDQIEEVADGTR